MRGLLLVLSAGLLLGCGGPKDASSTKSAEPGSKSPAVTGVTITDEGFDRDEDGSVETTHVRNPDGSLTVQIDTDGDGKPDVTRRIEADQAPPEGFDLPEGGIELTEVDPKPTDSDSDVPELR